MPQITSYILYALNSRVWSISHDPEDDDKLVITPHTVTGVECYHDIHGYKRVSYVVDEGLGDRKVLREAWLYPTRHAAQTECDKRKKEAY